MRRRIVGTRSVLLALAVLALAAIGAAPVAAGSTHKLRAHEISPTTTYGPLTPTFVGPAATGCKNSGCSLLSGPYTTSSTSPSAATNAPAAQPQPGDPACIRCRPRRRRA